MSAKLVVKPLHDMDMHELNDVIEADAKAYFATPLSIDDLKPGPKYAAFVDGNLIAVAGIWPFYGPDSARGIAWAYIKPQAKQVFRQLHFAVKKGLAEAPFQRIEAYCDVDFKQANKWVMALGFRPEGWFLRHFFPNGKTAHAYALIKD